MEQYRSLAPVSYCDSSLVVVVYDVCDGTSFDHLSFWTGLYLCDGLEHNSVLLIGNKTNRAERVIATDTGSVHTRQDHFRFLETSAKTGENVGQIVDELVICLKNRPPFTPIVPRSTSAVKEIVCC
jgi:GTPase SAR1 family protein